MFLHILCENISHDGCDIGSVIPCDLHEGIEDWFIRLAYVDRERPTSLRQFSFPSPIFAVHARTHALFPEDETNV